MVNSARQEIINRFGRLLDELAAEGYDTETMLAQWELVPDDFSPLVNMLLEPAGEVTSLAALAAQLGAEAGFIRQAWQSLGFSDERVTTGDALVVEMCEVTRTVMGEASAIQLLSVMGQTARRLAEAQIAEVRLRREIPMRSTGDVFPDANFAEELRLLAHVYLPMVSEAGALIHRRHLMITGAQTWGIDEAASTTLSDRVIGFTDLAGFTARSVAIDAGALADLIRSFEATVNEIVIAGHGRVVKLIGDEVMFSAESVDRGCQIALELRAAFSAQDLVSHSGLAFGAVLDQGGDYYGPVVNLAARLATLADAGHIVVGARVVPSAHIGSLTSLGPTQLRGFDEPQPAWLLEGPVASGE